MKRIVGATTQYRRRETVEEYERDDPDGEGDAK